MNLTAAERKDREIARLLGIRAKQENLGADSVLGNPEMVDLCRGRDNRGVKMLVGDFVNGWQVQRDIQVTFGKRGTCTFGTQAEAESYLVKMPVNYAGATRKIATGKWMLSYRRVEGYRAHTENCGRTGRPNMVANCRIDCGCWCHGRRA